jgi:hypothetical protein
LSPELRRWTDTLLDPEVWEHSSDYKPPPASHVTTISTPLSVSAVSVTVPASLTPVASPVADELSAFPVLAAEWLAEADAEAVAAAAARLSRYNAMAPTIIPAPVTGMPPLSRCRAYVPPLPAAAVYVRLDPERRDVYIYPAEEDEEPADGLTVADLPATVTESRLLEILRLKEHAEGMEERFDYARSYMSDARDPDDYGPGLSVKEYRLLEARYEAALAEQAEIYNTYGKEADEAKAAYKAAKDALLLELYGPEEA